MSRLFSLAFSRGFHTVVFSVSVLSAGQAFAISDLCKAAIEVSKTSSLLAQDFPWVKQIHPLMNTDALEHTAWTTPQLNPKYFEDDGHSLVIPSSAGSKQYLIKNDIPLPEPIEYLGLDVSKNLSSAPYSKRYVVARPMSQVVSRRQTTGTFERYYPADSGVSIINRYTQKALAIDRQGLVFEDIKFHPSKNLAYGISMDGVLYLLTIREAGSDQSVETQVVMRTTFGSRAPLRGIEVHPTGQWLAILEGSKHWIIELEPNKVNYYDGSFVGWLGRDEAVSTPLTITNLVSGQVTWRFNHGRFKEEIQGVLIAGSQPNSELVTVSGGRFGQLYIHIWSENKVLHQFTFITNSFGRPSISSDGKVLAIVENGEILLWELTTGKQVRWMADRGTKFSLVEFSPTNPRQVLVGSESISNFWNRNGENVQNLAIWEIEPTVPK